MYRAVEIEVSGQQNHNLTVHLKIGLLLMVSVVCKELAQKAVV